MAKGKKRKAAPGDVASNRQASYRYNLLERFECGIVLTGTEVKSLREGKAQLKDSYATIRDGEVWLIGVYIPPYGPRRARQPRPRAPAQAAAAPGRDRAPGVADQRAGPHPDPDADVLRGAAVAGQGRDRPGQGQGHLRQAPDDPPAGDGPRRPARVARGGPVGGRGR